MPNWWDMIPAPGQGPGVVPKDSSTLPSYGEQNPLVSALMKQPSIPNPSDPPYWMRQTIIDALRPVLDAGQWLGGVMGGNVQLTMGDAVTNLGGAALAGIMPPGARAAGAIEREAIPAAESIAKGIRAYHGSPHDFDRFDLSKIGTGEGAQAYGHGLYFAENPSVAQSYKSVVGNAPSSDIAAAHLERFNSFAPKTLTQADRDFAKQVIDERMGLFSGDSLGTVADHLKNETTIPHQNFDAVRSALAKVDDNPGRMYEVNINAHPEHFLDWDKPLSEQSEYVKTQLEPLLSEFRDKKTAVGEYLYRHLGRQEPKGEAGYKILQPADEPKASAALREAGIPGIKYLDQGSRVAGDGTRNYVVFNPDMVDIIKKYGLAGLSAYLGTDQLSIPKQQAPVF